MGKDVPFVRILISKSSYKPKVASAQPSSNNNKQQQKPAVNKQKTKKKSSSGEKKSKRTSPPILKTIDTTELCGTMANVTFDNLTYNPCPGAGASPPPPAAAGSPRETTRLNNLATIPEIGRSWPSHNNCKNN